MPIVDQRVQVAAVYGERNIDADVACGFSYGACFCWKVSKALHARVVRHHRADAPTRGAAEGDRGCKPGIDRGNEREIGKPGLERHVVAADLAQSDNARMVVRIGERRQNEGSGSGAGSGRTVAMRPASSSMTCRACGGSFALGRSHDAARRCVVSVGTNIAVVTTSRVSARGQTSAVGTRDRRCRRQSAYSATCRFPPACRLPWSSVPA